MIAASTGEVLTKPENRGILRPAVEGSGNLYAEAKGSRKADGLVMA